jgi:hypothetical protein
VILSFLLSTIAFFFVVVASAIELDVPEIETLFSVGAKPRPKPKPEKVPLVD